LGQETDLVCLFDPVGTGITQPRPKSVDVARRMENGVRRRSAIRSANSSAFLFFNSDGRKQ